MTVTVITHRNGSYPAIVRPGAIADLARELELRHPTARPVIISDTTVAAAQPSPLSTASCITFPAGEQSKNRKHWSMLTDQLIDSGYDRNTVIVAFGGGVTLDLAGFVAATFLRGVPWMAVPTSTLAMIDASIGGKTGVDTAAGKNLVGAFHPPSAVISDPTTLATLPRRNYHEGLAEAVKHAAAMDAGYGEWLLEHRDGIGNRDVTTVTELVRRSVELKAAVVSEDEQESGRRAILNAGHTVAHALEIATGFGLPHGEAVAIGLVLETRVAEASGLCAAGTVHRVVDLLTALDLPTTPPPFDRDRFFTAIAVDKKNRNGVVVASLLREFGSTAKGQAGWATHLDLDLLKSFL